MSARSLFLAFVITTMLLVDSFVIRGKNAGQYCHSFPVVGKLQMERSDTANKESAASMNDDEAIQCFIVNAFEVEEEGAEPEIVCTPKPDEYAWFNGLDPEDMKPANDASASADILECVEGASPRGVPEWECKKKREEDISWQ